MKNLPLPDTREGLIREKKLLLLRLLSARNLKDRQANLIARLARVNEALALLP